MYRIAIVGRPNVGKSTLFNRLAGHRKAIVGDEPGITRDRLFETVSRNGKRFEIIDTGGLLPEDKEVIPENILAQAEIAMQESDLILLVVDVRDGLTPLDLSLNTLLRSKGREYLLVVNKVDVDSLEQEAMQFYSLGVEDLFAISAEHNQGVTSLVETILERVPETQAARFEGEIRVAIVGHPNVGKSSLLNRLLGQQRSIVTDLPGTTRDAVDSIVRADGQTFRLVDTAGIRRKGKTSMRTEKLSVVMARKNLERSDVVLLVIDASEGATKLDATIGSYAHDAGKSVILVANKWDLVSRDTHTLVRLEEEFREKMRYLDYAPFLFVSAKTGQRVSNLLRLAAEAYQARLIRLSTSELNSFLEKEVHPLLPSGNRKFPIKFLAQVSVAPPTFVCFIRSSKKLHFSTQRFLIKRLRERCGFFATPVRLLQRPSSRR